MSLTVMHGTIAAATTIKQQQQLNSLYEMQGSASRADPIGFCIQYSQLREQRRERMHWQK